MTLAAILQPSYLPWLGFFEQMTRADVFVYLDDVQYTKNDWRNRNRVKTASGPTWLTVPVATAGRLHQRIFEAELSETGFGRRHTRTVASAYAKAPFLESAEGLFDIWSSPPTNLVDLNLAAIDWARTQLAITTPTLRSSSLGIEETDPNRRLVEICRRIGATGFYEGAAGSSYLDVGLFESNGVSVSFQAYDHPWYPQQHRQLGFLSHLSVVDLILNTGPDAKAILTGALVLSAPEATANRHPDDFR